MTAVRLFISCIAPAVLLLLGCRPPLTSACKSAPRPAFCYLRTTEVEGVLGVRVKGCQEYSAASFSRCTFVSPVQEKKKLVFTWYHPNHMSGELREFRSRLAAGDIPHAVRIDRVDEQGWWIPDAGQTLRGTGELWVSTDSGFFQIIPPGREGSKPRAPRSVAREAARWVLRRQSVVEGG